VREEDFTLDPTGNWSGYLQKTSGTTVLDQDRDHNHVNEIDVDDDHGNAAGASITASTGINWADPTYDAAGNMTKMPRPKQLFASHTCTFDAWNRLVEVQEGVSTHYVFAYDGLGRRISEGEVGPEIYSHFFFNDSWQTLESRWTGMANPQPETLQPNRQYVWSARYIDSPVLRDKNGDQDGQGGMPSAAEPRSACR
jgi:hypothetical protein